VVLLWVLLSVCCRFQVFVALFAEPVFNGNKKAACLAVFNTNIFTGVFIFAFNYWLGKTIFGFNTAFIFPDRIGLDFIIILFAAGKEVILWLLLGWALNRRFIRHFGLLRNYLVVS